MKEKSDIERFHDEFLDLAPELVRLLEIVEQRIQSRLLEEGIELAVPIRKRVKDWESLKPKLEKMPYNYMRLQEIKDLAGIRIVTLFPRELDIIEPIISNEFRVNKRYDKRWQLDTDQFGYTSIHYVIEWEDPSTKKPFFFVRQGTKVEIQLRTLAQHIWSEVSHKLQYKKESSVPSLLRRRIHRVSAALEGVDDQLEVILTERDRYRTGIANLESDEPLNVDNLAATLDFFWPSEHKSDDEKYDYLLGYLSSEGVNTLRQLSAILRAQKENVIDYSSRYAKWLVGAIEKYPFEGGTLKIEEPNRHLSISGITPMLIERAKKGIYYSQVALTVTAIQYHTGEREPGEQP